MSRAWNALETRLVRAEHRARTNSADSWPPGAISVMFYGLAVCLGDFPTPTHPRTITEADDVIVAVDRALGYADALERSETFTERDEEWASRFIAAVKTLCEQLGLSAPDLSLHDEATLLAFIRMLDEIAAIEPSWSSPPGLPRGHPWYGVDNDMDTWIKAAGFSSDALREKASSV